MDLNNIVKKLHTCYDDIQTARESFVIDDKTNRDLQLALDQIQSAIMWTNHAIYSTD